MTVLPAPISIDGRNIRIHGRGSLNVKITAWRSGVQEDLSERLLYFEVDPPGFRVALAADPIDPLARRLMLSRARVEKLRGKPARFVLVDETVEDFPVARWTGEIAFVGFVKSGWAVSGGDAADGGEGTGEPVVAVTLETIEGVEIQIGGDGFYPFGELDPDVFYYRTEAGTYAAVTLGAGLTFTNGVLSIVGGGGSSVFGSGTWNDGNNWSDTDNWDDIP